MIFIIFILAVIIAFMIYIYGGLKLSESYNDNPTMIAYFWASYFIFGITILLIVLLGNFWGVLSNKTGPPGPRGPRGERGELGITGECGMNENFLYASKKIKEDIVSVFTKEYNKEELSKVAEIYDRETLRLKNTFIDGRVQLMITSKQFETILLIPEVPNPEKLRYGKSLEELTLYLSNIWVSWFEDLIKKDRENTLKMMKQLDGQIDISKEIEDYFQKEVVKYDIWYWGTTNVFRPLKAEVCRRGLLSDDFENTRMPIPNKPLLEVKTIQYTDKTIDSVVNPETKRKAFRKLFSLHIPNNDKDDKWDVKTNYNSDFSVFYGVVSKYKLPTFYIPDVNGFHYETGQKFYPVGCVVVEGDPERKTGESRKTIVVSGDILIPDTFIMMWNNYKKGRNVCPSCRGDWEDGMGGNTPLRFWRLESTHSDYRTLGDFFGGPDCKEVEDLKKLIHVKDKHLYWGPVALPKKCLTRVGLENLPEWGYRRERGKSGMWGPNFNIHRYAHRGTEIFKSKNNYNILRARFYRKHIGSNKGVINDGNPYSYKINKKCSELIDKNQFKKDGSSATGLKKELDERFSELGFGWFGYPHKKYRKYSIFAYLGLMPEGIIVHRKTGRKYYIKHYGGMEPNRFFIYFWNENRKKYNNAVMINNSNGGKIGKLNETDSRFHFRVELDSKNDTLFRFRPLNYPDKYLNIDFNISRNVNLHGDNLQEIDKKILGKRPGGISIEHMEMIVTLKADSGALNKMNGRLFYNYPSYGVDMNIYNEKEAQDGSINRSKSQEEQIDELLGFNENRNYDYIFKRQEPKELIDEDGEEKKFPGSKINYGPKALPKQSIDIIKKMFFKESFFR